MKIVLTVINWQVNPLIIDWGYLRIAWYGVLFALAFFIGNKLMVKIFKEEGISLHLLDKFFMYIFIGIVVGSRLGHCLFYDWQYFSLHPLEIFMIWKGGLASHGGIIGIFIATYFFTKKFSTLKFSWLLDRLSLALLMGAPLIRLGNFMNSEIVGSASNLPWSVKFLNHLTTRPDLLINENVIARHPVQLYEAIIYSFIFIVLFIFYRTYKNFPNGFLAAMGFFLVFSSRFFLEFLKVRQADFAINNILSVGQWLSLPLIFLSLIFLVYNIKICKN